MSKLSMRGKDFKEWAAKLPDDAHVLCQVVGQDGSAWTMALDLSGELTHFQWDAPVFGVTVSHPMLESVNPSVVWVKDRA